MGPLPVSPARFLLRLALVSMAVLWLAKQYSANVVELLVPVIRAEILALDDNISIESLQITREQGALTLLLRANTLRTIYFKQFIVFPLGVRPQTNGWYQVHGNVRGALLSSVIFLIVLMSWPQRNIREFILRLLVGLPLLAILFAVDTPLDLLGNFQAAVVHSVDRGTTPFLYTWDRFLQGGGSAAIAFALAAVAISLAVRGARSGSAVRLAGPAQAS